jgi:hypothetical protein
MKVAANHTRVLQKAWVASSDISRNSTGCFWGKKDEHDGMPILMRMADAVRQAA